MLASVKRATLIVNPYSTQVTGKLITDVERVLRERLDVQTEFTRHPGHATELAAQAAGSSDAMLVLSGDGTYNVALKCADGTVPFGYVPGGGTNVLPRALGLPRSAVAAAREVRDAVAEGRTRRISLGAVNGRRFCFSAGIGFDAEAVRRLDELGRRPGGARPGDLAFGWMVMRMLRERRGGSRSSRSTAAPAPRSSSSPTATPTRTPARSHCTSPRTPVSRAASTSSRRPACAHATCRGS